MVPTRTKIGIKLLSEKRWEIEGCSSDCRLTGNRNTVFTKGSKAEGFKVGNIIQT